MNARNTKLLMLAKKVSICSEYKFRHGTVIAKGNRVLGVGINSTKSHPKSHSRFKTIHSEHQALINSGLNELKGAIAYVYRETKDGQPAESKPCASCSMLLKQAGIKKVYFSISTYPFWGYEEYE